jgi:7-cyano-7-deazaguanine synthase in queuosine biosynthesis
LLLHFNYGQKGCDAEGYGLERLYNKMLLKGMNVMSRHFDLSSLYKNEPSELVDPDIEVTTGTQNIKSTTAWVSARNLMFSSYAITLAEQFILRNQYKEVKISAGYFNLSESGIYPDNSEYFGLALNEVVKYGTLCANKIEFMPLYANVMKSEEWILGQSLDFPFETTVSCDQPKIEDGEIYLCDNCGSTKLSQWAAMMVGIKDPRKFYHIDQSRLNDYEPKIEWNQKHISSMEVINKLNLSSKAKYQLLQLIKGKEKGA